VLRAALTGGSTSDTLSPYNPVTVTDYARILQLYDGLAYLDRNATPQLGLAEEITPNSDATTWTVRLRSGLTFHNGQTVTAEDVVYSFNNVLNAKSPGISAPLATLIEPKLIRAVDKLTVEFPCSGPFSTFLDTVAEYNTFAIVPVGYNPKNPVGTGPFKLKSFTPGTQSTFTRNPDYYITGLPYVDSLVISDYSDETSQLNAIQGGQADVVNQLSAASLATLHGSPVKVLISQGGAWTPFTMRVDQAPFNDVRVRQAMRLIVDRQQMLEQLFAGHGTVGNDLFAIWDADYDHSIPQRTQDIDQAKALLKQAGHANLNLTLITADLAQGVVGAAQLFAQQASAAGVTVQISQKTVTDFYGPSYLKWTFAQDFWDYNPYWPQVAFALAPASLYNETHWRNPQYVKLYAEGLATVDVTKRKEIAAEMQMLAYDQSGYIIPYFPPVIDGYGPKVMGGETSKLESFNNFDFKHLWFAA
jgi:peptide/nickel transport system substrate-binding protein